MQTLQGDARDRWQAGNASTLNGDKGRSPVNYRLSADAGPVRCEPATLAEAPGRVVSGPYGMSFAVIPTGTFLMGSESGGEDQKPVHEVRIIQLFEAQRTPVTQEQWQAVMGGNPSKHYLGGPKLPVERVSWHDALTFIRRLNALKDGYVYRLPTEAEWEYVARAGSTGEYAGTGNLDEMGWFRGNSRLVTHPVQQKAPNEWGLYDMHGNVFEWVSDWYAPYGNGSETDPRGPSSGKKRVIRGGCFGYEAKDCTSAARYAFSAETRSDGCGFRMVRQTGVATGRGAAPGQWLRDLTRSVYGLWQRRAYVALVKTAERGDARAKSDLAMRLALGKGVDRDLVEAAKWATLAHMLASPEDRMQFEKNKLFVERLLTRDQLLQVETRVSAWLAASRKRTS